MQFKVKTISSLCKVFPDTTPVAEECHSGTVVTGGRFPFQLAMYYNHRIREMEITVDSPLKEHIRLRQVAIPLIQMTSVRAKVLYDLADSAYDAPEIKDFSKALGRVAKIRDRRGTQKN